MVCLDDRRVELDTGFGLPRFGADPHLHQLIASRYHAFGPEQAQSQLEVMPGGPHDDAEFLAVHVELQRFFGGDAVVDGIQRLAIPTPDGDRR